MHKEMLTALVNELNDEQRAAVTAEPGHCLALAGAGSGKTKTLTARLGWIIANEWASKHEIFAVTFTNKAAKEMLSRLDAALQLNPKGMWVGTFHGLCARMLRNFHKEAGLPRSFKILDMDDVKSMVKGLYRDHGWNEESCPPKDAIAAIMSWKEEGKRCSSLTKGDLGIGPRGLWLSKVYLTYEKKLADSGCTDFPELLLKTVELLRSKETIREWAKQEFRFIMVDEFQDTNRLQYELIDLLSGQGDTPVFAVGDLDQSIYAFRGAKPENLARFERDYGKRGGVRLLKLEKNYRSTDTILSAANAVIENNKGRFDKTLVATKGKGEPIKALLADTDQDEARFVAETLRELISRGAKPERQAILYRTNALSRGFEHELNRARIKYRVWGGLRFYERMEIKHALAYMRLAAEPKDELSFMRVINVPSRGIGAKTISKMRERFVNEGKSLYEIALSWDEGGKSGDGIRSFAEIIDLLNTAYKDGASLTSISRMAIERSGLLSSYEQDKEDEDRVDNLKELVSGCEQFENDPLSTEIDLESFLAQAALEGGERSDGDEGVNLMTVHAAKGLEFENVFLCGLEDGTFPHQKSIGVSDKNDSEEMSEERRLMYVAITRAEKGLFMSLARERVVFGERMPGRPSRFLSEIPSHLVEDLTGGELSRKVKWERFGPHPSSVPPRNEGSVLRVTPPSSQIPREDLQALATAAGWTIGEKVRHVKFGIGVVLKAEGSNDNVAVIVDFKDGPKRLIVKYAKLERLG